MGPDARKPLLPGRGLMLIADFCRHTGLDLSVVEPLMRSGDLDGLFDASDRPYALFDDPLPSAARLRALELSVSSGYRSGELSSYKDDEEDPNEPGDGGPTWTMSWPDQDRGPES